MTALPDVGDDFGTFRIVEVVGGSAMGKVYAARQRGLGRVEALKVLAPSWIDADDYRDRFERDAETLARLDSQHIVDIHAHGDVDGTPYISTEFVRGGDLGGRLRERGRLAAAVALEIASQVAAGLEDAHGDGVIHANLKPSNVLLREGGDPFAYLCDFGIARSDSVATTKAAVGNWEYLAPECCRGGDPTVGSDIYSVGCLLWAMLTGEAPYRGTDLEVAIAHLRDPVPQLDGDDEWTLQTNAVLARTLSKTPEGRFATAGELRAALVELADSSPDQESDQPAWASPPPEPAPPQIEPAAESDDPLAGWPTSPPRSGQPGKRSLALLAAALVVVVAAAAVLLSRSPDTSADDRPAKSPASSAAPSASASSSASGSPSASASPSSRTASGAPTVARRPQTAAQLARLSRPSYEGGTRSLVAVQSLDSSSGYIRAFGLAGKRSLVPSAWRLPATAPGKARQAPTRVNGDFDGNGKTDVAIVNDGPNGTGAVLVARSTGKGFAAPSRWGTIPRSTADRISTVTTGDFNGDGHMDLAVAEDRTPGRSFGVTVLLSTGTRFRAPVSWASGLPWDDRYVKLAPGDFNSDGCTDLVAFVGNSRKDAISVRMLLSNGKRLVPSSRSWYDGALPTTDLSAIRPVAGDFNGDGSTDVMVFAPEFFTGNLEALFLTSDGKQLTRASAPWWTSTTWTLGGTRMSVGDFDGNGRSDVACLVGGGRRGVRLTLLTASGSTLRQEAAVSLPKRSFSRTGLLDVTG